MLKFYSEKYYEEKSIKIPYLLFFQNGKENSKSLGQNHSESKKFENLISGSYLVAKINPYFYVKTTFLLLKGTVSLEKLTNCDCRGLG